MFNELRFDYNSNRTFRLVTNCLVLFLTIPISYYVTRSWEPQWKGAELFYTMLCNIAYGYIASAIFYYANIYLPERDFIEEQSEKIAHRTWAFNQKISSLTAYLAIKTRDGKLLDHIPVVLSNGEKSERNMKDFMDGNRKVFQKDYQHIDVLLTDTQIKSALIQNLQLLVYDTTFSAYTFDEWMDYADELKSGVKNFITTLEKMESATSIRVIEELKDLGLNFES